MPKRAAPRRIGYGPGARRPRCWRRAFDEGARYEPITLRRRVELGMPDYIGRGKRIRTVGLSRGRRNTQEAKRGSWEGVSVPAGDRGSGSSPRPRRISPDIDPTIALRFIIEFRQRD